MANALPANSEEVMIMHRSLVSAYMATYPTPASVQKSVKQQAKWAEAHCEVERKKILSQRWKSVFHSRLRAIVFLSLVGLVSCSLQAQSTFGSIRGTVQDPSGAIVPRAAVTVHSLDENFDRQGMTNEAGEFIVENLQPGHYSVTIEHEGFAKATVPNAQLDARQDLRIPITLSVALQATEVVVNAAANLIDTEDATLGDSQNNQMITQLPLNDRATTTSPLGSLELSPNVQQDSSGNIALGGASSSMVNFSVDGISTSNVRQNGALARPSQN
jgi:hypothetical protein